MQKTNVVDVDDKCKRKVRNDGDDTGVISSKKRIHNGGRNRYQGYKFPEDNDSPPTIDLVDCQSITPQEFFEKYIAQRRPCILTGVMESPFSSTTLQDILQKMQLSTQSVTVEKRQDTPNSRFGQSRKFNVEMKLSDFVRICLADKDEASLYYLTTQMAPEQQSSSSSVFPSAFFGPPCDMLKDIGLIPETLALAGQLKPQSCNLWMGSAGKSSIPTNDHTSSGNGPHCHHSGLHHDFHDNFYVLLHGRKQFRLFAPSDHLNLAVAGSIEIVHENGLISYTNNPTRSNGVPLFCAADQDSERSNDEESSDEGAILGKGFDYKSSDDDDDESTEPVCAGSDVFEDQNNDDFEKVTKDHNREVQNGDNTLPDHFSYIDPSMQYDMIIDTFPCYRRARECIAQLDEGQCLYLPASWFHCVTSLGQNKQHGVDARHESIHIPSSVHVALNYWFYPPDNLRNFANPYSEVRLTKPH